MDMDEFFLTDSVALHSQMKRQENHLKLKRRWLMGLPLSDHEEKDLRSGLRENETLPESLVRSDDVQYEIVKTFVEKGFSGSSLHGGHHADPDSKQNIAVPDLRKFLSMLDDMTNYGLQLLAEIVTGGSIKFEKTRWKMKKIIRKSLPRVYKNLKSNGDGDLAKQLHHLLRNPLNFRRNCISSDVSTSQLYHAAIKVLDGLEEMSHQCLSAMHRKLRGIKEYVPQLQPKKSGWGRSGLIDEVRRRSLELLSELGEGDELQEPLAKAMAVGGLSFKLLQGCSFVHEFWQFSPEIGALQTEIAKAIWLLKDNVAFRELKNLQLLLDRDAQLSNRSLRAAVRNLLIEYLFECSDMKPIPDSLIKALAIINGSSKISPPYRFFSKEEKEEEVEHVLVVSAQIKQILWDMFPENDLDEDFKDAYMEDLEESDDDYFEENDTGDKQGVIAQTNLFPLYFTREETVGESNPVSSVSDASTNEGNSSYSVLTPEGGLRSDSTERAENENENVSTDSSLGLNFDHSKTSTSENQYLAIQEACDKTSMVAYSLIGCLLDEIAQIDAIPLGSCDVSYLRGDNSSRESYRAAREEGTSNEEEVHGSIVKVLEELLPSFPQSGKARLKEFMGSK